MAVLVATRSTCIRRQIGAVLVRKKRVLATGYNGAARNLPHCLDIGCLRDELEIPSGTRHEVCRAVHAEANVIIQCAIYGISSENSTIYVTVWPCRMCARLIINAGIQRVVVIGKYSDEEGLQILRKAGIPIDIINLETGKCTPIIELK